MNCTDKTITLGDDLYSHVIAALELRMKHPEVYRDDDIDSAYMNTFQLLCDSKDKDKDILRDCVKDMDAEVGEVVKQLVFVWEMRDHIFARKLLAVYGFEREAVQKCIERGLGSLEQVAERINSIPLNENQQLGLKYHSDISQPIPRAEIEQHAKQIEDLLEASEIKIEIMGAYRREQPTSQAIELLFIFPPESIGVETHMILIGLLARLTDTGYLVAELPGDKDDPAGGWEILVRLPLERPVGRMSIFLTSQDRKGAAKLWYTGSELFVEAMRMVSAAKGMRLAHDGLYRVDPNNDEKGVLPGGMDYRVLSTGLENHGKG